MHVVAAFAVAAVLVVLFPRASDVLAWVVTLFFILPVAAFGATCLAYPIDWLLIGGGGGGAVFMRDFYCVGLPFGLFVSWLILK